MPSDKSPELDKELLSRGFEQSLCYEIAYRQLNTDRHKNAWLFVQNEPAYRGDA